LSYLALFDEHIDVRRTLTHSRVGDIETYRILRSRLSVLKQVHLQLSLPAMVLRCIRCPHRRGLCTMRSHAESCSIFAPDIHHSVRCTCLCQIVDDNPSAL
jgi:hypothetical protein